MAVGQVDDHPRLVALLHDRGSELPPEPALQRGYRRKVIGCFGIVACDRLERGVRAQDPGVHGELHRELSSPLLERHQPALGVTVDPAAAVIAIEYRNRPVILLASNAHRVEQIAAQASKQ